MNRRQFLVSLPVLPVVAFTDGMRPPEEAIHRDALDRFHRHVKSGSPLAGSGAVAPDAPSLLETMRAVVYFAQRPR